MDNKTFLRAIVESYQYTHDHCTYGPSGTTFPPAQAPDFLNDCVGLVLYAFHLLGLYPHPYTIDQVVDLCLEHGFEISFDEDDVWRHAGVACYQDNNNTGTNHVNHVYYSLGGTSRTDISKYDLGSNVRIKAEQPFTHVRCNEWEDRRHFYCHLYIKDDYLAPLPDVKDIAGTLGKVLKPCGLYTGAGRQYEKLGTAKVGDDVIIHPIYVTSQTGNLFRYVTHVKSGKKGYIYKDSIMETYSQPYTAIVSGTDGTLNVRQGIGTETPIVGEYPEGTVVVVSCEAINSKGEMWANVRNMRYKKKDKTIFGWVSMAHLQDSD